MANFGATILAIIVLGIFMGVISGFIISVTHVNLDSKNWKCTKHSEWRVYEEEQYRDCIQYTNKELNNETK